MLSASLPCSALLLAATASGADEEALFVERTDWAGDVETRCGGRDKDYILEVNGGGLALADFDGDGDVDLALVDGASLEAARAGEPGRPPRLLANAGDGTLRPAGEAWRIAPGRFGMGAAAGDVDGDGWSDLIVTEWGPDRLVRNASGKGFEEVAEAGLVGERWGTSAVLLDVDGDGDLDLAVANYLAFSFDDIPSRVGGTCRWKGHAVMCGPEGLTPVHDQLYRNDGTGRLSDESVALGFRPRRAGFGLGITSLDVDVDGDTDLYVTNDSTPNHLWRNELAEGGRFVEVGLRQGVSVDANGKEQAGMGIGCGDVNGDGIPDLFATNFSGESNAFYLSGANGRWRERAAPAGLGGPSVRTLGWGASMEDFDLDGVLDLAVFNGHVYPQADLSGTDSSYAQPNFLHRGLPNARFATEPLSAGAPGVSRAAAAADLDGDGDLDLVALELDGPLRIYENRALSRGDGEAPHWLAVRLVGRATNRAGIGAIVSIESAGLRASREVRTSGGYQAAVPAEARFGLGPLDRVERLEVRWPSGARSLLTDVAVDRRLVVEEPEVEQGLEESEPSEEPQDAGRSDPTRDGER